MTCLHESFRCSANVGGLSQVEGGPITGYTVDIMIECTQCGLPFRFIGLAAGNSPDGPRVSVDGKELRAPLEPATHQKFAAVAEYRIRGGGVQ